MFRKCTSENGVSRGTKIRRRRSFSTTSAARSTRLRLFPVATPASVAIEQGQMTIPAVSTDPDAGRAPRSSSVNSSTCRQPFPTAAASPAGDSMPHSSRSNLHPCDDTMSQTGVADPARTWSSLKP